MGRGARIRKGFTLIELMLVVAIIGLLAAIAIPKFANLVVKAKEASIKGKLGALRSAVSIYYSDNEGFYPPAPGTSLFALTIGSRYLDEFPSIEIPTQIPLHPNSKGINNALNDGLWTFASAHPAWTYAGDGVVFVNCTHTDSNGTTWSLW